MVAKATASCLVQVRHDPWVSKRRGRGGMCDSWFCSADHEFVFQHHQCRSSISWFLNSFLITYATPFQPFLLGKFMSEASIPNVNNYQSNLTYLLSWSSCTQPGWRSCSRSSPTSQPRSSPRSLAMALLRWERHEIDTWSILNIRVRRKRTGRMMRSQ